MRVLVVDDELPALHRVEEQLAKIDFVTDYEGFTEPQKALDSLRAKPADAALLDINMLGMTGLEMAKKAREICPQMGIVFLTGYGEYALDAFRLHASGYLMKPATRQEIADELNRLCPTENTKAGLKIKTFGNFEVFYNGEPLHFKRNKSKELLAYLIDRRGAMVSQGELIAALFEDMPETQVLHSQIRNCVSDLNQTLSAIHAEDILLRERGGLAIRPDLIRCDYYRLLDGKADINETYMGEYMTSYAWAETTNGLLAQKYDIY